MPRWWCAEAGCRSRRAATLPWASGVARHPEGLVPLLDLSALGSRITETASSMTTGDDIQVVTFRVGRQEFAFDILQVERILRYGNPRRCRKAPEFLEGVIQYAGGAVPVVDLRKRFELEAPIREETRLMVLDSATSGSAWWWTRCARSCGWTARPSRRPAPMVSGLAAAYIAGIVTRPGRTIIILNARKLLSATERHGARAAIGSRRDERAWLAGLRAQYQEIAGRLGGVGDPADARGAQARDHRALQAGGRRAHRAGPAEGGHPRAGGAVQAGEHGRAPAAAPAPAVHRRAAGGARRPPRRLDVHREGLEPDLAGRLRRGDPGAREGARRCRPARCRRSRCSAGRRCCTRSTTTRWGPSPRC